MAKNGHWGRSIHNGGGAAQACQKKTQINRRTLSAFRTYILIGRTQNSFRQILATIYVALAEAAGGPAALRRANQVLRDAIADGAADDPTAIMLLESLAHDEDDEDASEIVDLLDDLAVASIH
jgi:hypothetical protein